ncbi:MAG: hypothetical protein M1825_004027 [Sarcosagium campestre]|nr:MAG: hypothetical protein M1825_004027 [Sarcosagium campestre]
MDRAGVENRFYALVTGANGGLGFAICCRLIDEYLDTRPPTHSIHLIFTTRSSKKGAETLATLHRRFRSRPDASTRVILQTEVLDLSSLRSVQALSWKLCSTTPRLDAVILNAGIAGVIGVKWLLATWLVLSDLVQSVTWPTYTIPLVGSLTKSQLDVPERVDIVQNRGLPSDEPPLGEVFCSNVFGHYMLIHQLVPLLHVNSSSSREPGRVIWISSIEAVASCFSTHDIQGLTTPVAYASTKRLTDLLALTAHLPASSPSVSRFLSSDSPKSGVKYTSPRLYVAHPGVCATAIVPLIAIAWWAMLAITYVARWLGSSWHVVSPYKGATAPAWVALRSQAELDRIEQKYGLSKWGSAVDFWGNERVQRTHVDGWGFGGLVGEKGDKRSGRRRGAADVTADSRHEFELEGRECWEQMEALRAEWESILGSTDFDRQKLRS